MKIAIILLIQLSIGRKQYNHIFEHKKTLYIFRDIELEN